MRPLLLVLVLAAMPAFAATQLPAAVRYVDCLHGDDSNDGLAWASASRSITGTLGTLPACVWSYGPPCLEVLEINVAGECDEPFGVSFPPGASTIVRGTGFATIKDTFLRFEGNYRCIVEGISAPGLRVEALAGSLEVRSSELYGVNAVNADLLVENSVVLDFGISYTNPNRRAGSLIVRDSIVERIGVSYGTPPPPEADDKRGLGVVRLEGNTVATTVVLYAYEGSRMTALLQNNLLLGFPPVSTFGKVSVGGNQR